MKLNLLLLLRVDTTTLLRLGALHSFVTMYSLPNKLLSSRIDERFIGRGIAVQCNGVDLRKSRHKGVLRQLTPDKCAVWRMQLVLLLAPRGQQHLFRLLALFT
jgi:hypothetical protein